MTWAALIQILFNLFGPLIAAWLKKRLDPAKMDAVRFPASTEVAIGTYFAALRAGLRWWNPKDWGALARVNLLERIADRHTPRIAQAQRFGDAAPMLAAEDLDELAEAF
jgi:hypothetical protein